MPDDSRQDQPAGSRASVPTFCWGVATSSYQIEGAADADGRSPSIWDRFSHAAGRIEDGSTGDVATDHYHRYAEDVRIMADIGLDAYRFSIAWSRILPRSGGPVNEAGLDFYERLVDALLGAGITPFVTLYHWDLPAYLQDEGGWPRRETAARFVEYAQVVARRLGDRVGAWMTHNEPWCASILGYLEGRHAPGLTDGAAALRAAHHMLLSHGWAAQALRAEIPTAQVGLAHMYIHAEPASGSPHDAQAARLLDGRFNRWFLDPLYGRGYPEDVVAHYRARGFLDGDALPFVQAGDLEAMAAPTDFLGMNYYTRGVARSTEVPEAENAPREVHEAPAEARTDMGWEIYPRGLELGLRRLHSDYGPSTLYVTENGVAYATGPDSSGRVEDPHRIDFLRRHICAVADARDAGVPVKGYFVWSLLDNFEWSFGYAKRFGIVWVDYETGARTLKDSARWYRDEITRRHAAWGEAEG